MGHGADLTFVRFIMSGGGVLLRGSTLRRLQSSGVLSKCIQRVHNGTWCYHHLDWVLAECLRDIGVMPSGHEAFQQMVDKCNSCCNPPRVSCHPVSLQSELVRLLKTHSEYERHWNFSPSADWS